MGELASLAEAIGRRFDSEVWSALASGAPDPRTSRATRPRRTLADLLPEIARASDRPTIGAGGPTDIMPRFIDDAEAVGLRFNHDNGTTPGRLIPPVTSSRGVGLIDYDGDGWLDVYAVQAGLFPPPPAEARQVNYWMMDKRVVTLSFILFATGFAAALYALFILACDHAVEVSVRSVVPKDSPLWWCLAGIAVFFVISHSFIKYLEDHDIHLRL